jgi:hypothetical protein
MNVDVIYGFDSSLNAFDVRWDTPSTLAGNSQWNILGVNVYRSFDSEFGPYYRLNDAPLGATFYRDQTLSGYVEDEDVTNSFLATGKDDEAGRWIFRTENYPIVKPNSENVPAEYPTDIVLKIDGQEVLPAMVYGTTGEVELRTDRIFDKGRNALLDPVLPRPNSVVTCSYRYALNTVVNELDRKVFYRVTSVGVREWDNALRESPLEWCIAKTVHHMENLDYIWREAIHRNAWILDQGGERVFVYIRKWSGERCLQCWDNDYKQPRNSCGSCYGTSIVGGYEGPYEIKVAPPEAEKRIKLELHGFSMEHTYEVWTGPSPLLSQRDFLVKQNNDRYSIGPVRVPSNRGNILQQHFSVDHIDENDIRYTIPLNLGSMVYPQTRTTTHDEDPTKLNSPQITEKEELDDSQEERGRTPTYGNINS